MVSGRMRILRFIGHVSLLFIWACDMRVLSLISRLDNDEHLAIAEERSSIDRIWKIQFPSKQMQSI